VLIDTAMPWFTVLWVSLNGKWANAGQTKNAEKHIETLKQENCVTTNVNISRYFDVLRYERQNACCESF